MLVIRDLQITLFFVVFTFCAQSLQAQAKYYLTSSTGQPWNQNSNITCLNTVFGANNWNQASFQTVNVNAMLTGTTCLIYLEGGDSHANALNTFLMSNLTALQTWVFNGGRLFINSAPNQGGNINFGFGGVTLNYSTGPYSTPGFAAPGQSLHPIFTGTNTPCVTSFTGNWFTHGYITGGNTTVLMQGNYSGIGLQTTLSELNWGAGLVMFGSMTLPNFHQPQPQAMNLVNNILSYLYICCPITATASPSAICMGSGSTLTANGAVSYTWSPSSTVASSIMVTPSVSSVYSVVGTNSIGCHGATTVSVTVNPPCVSVNSTSITCASLGSATVISNGGIGPFSYTWFPSAQSGSVAVGLSPGTYTIVVHDFGSNFTYTTTTVFTSLIPLTGNLVSSPSVSCFGGATATAAIINIAGGSGNQNYIWTNGAVTYTVPNPQTLSAGLWSVNVTDALTGCIIGLPFFISQPPAQNPIITASSPTVCAGSVISLTAGNSGGVPGPGAGYTYTWSTGIQSSLCTVSQSLAGNYVYTVYSSDGNACQSSQTIALDFVPNPTLVVTNVSICPLHTGTLGVFGASTYTWNGISSGSSFTDNPLVNTQYTVVGSAFSCTTAATASIIILPVPIPTLSSNSPVCQGGNLMFSVNPGSSFSWTGVSGYSSLNQTNTLSVAHPTQSGQYQVTVTAANTCTASAQISLSVHPTPSLSTTGASICINQVLQLQANSFPGSNFVWTGPNGFVSLLQNPVIPNPSVSSSGQYTVLATSPPGCTISAQAHVTVTPLPVISFGSNSPVCSGQNLILFSYNTSGAQQFVWSGPAGFSSSQQNPLISPAGVNASGLYTLMVSTGPCTVSASMSATVLALPVPLAGNSGPACEGKQIQLLVNNSALTYTWTGPNGYQSTQQNPVLNPLQLNQSGMYTVSVTDQHSCSASAVSAVTVLANPVLQATGDQVCLLQPAQLNVSGANTYTWIGPGSFYTTGASPQVSSAVNTQVWTYTVTGTALNGCTTIATSTVATFPLPVPTLSVSPRVCVHSTIFLNGGGGLIYTWTGPLNFYANQQNCSLQASNIGTGGIYSLTVKDANACQAMTTALVIVDPEPGGEIMASTAQGCVPFCSSFSLQAAVSGTLSQFLWEINSQVFSTEKIQYCFNTPGQFELTGSFVNSQNCRAKLSKWIEVYPLPEAAFTYWPLKPVELSESLHVINTSQSPDQLKWTWAFDDGKNQNRSGAEADYVFEDAGFYTIALKVENKWSCSDTVLQVVEVLPDFGAYVPNAFTPNGDGLNDSFFPVLRGVKSFSLEVFDRWGGLLFASSTPDKTWDGTAKGMDCKEDIYNYTLVILNVKGEKKSFTGQVTLYR
ncbi:MAG TPA: gliding motility-associated C-terminal domain-containing protein [Bacteroidia bacterium]|nr:gliding motility-associated C-terminal domain-containing protein [Bacteroidia bacterium]